MVFRLVDRLGPHIEIGGVFAVRLAVLLAGQGIACVHIARHGSVELNGLLEGIGSAEGVGTAIGTATRPREELTIGRTEGVHIDPAPQSGGGGLDVHSAQHK